MLTIDRLSSIFNIKELVELAQSLGIGKASEEFESHVLVDMIIEQKEHGSNHPLYKEFFGHLEPKEIELENFELPSCYDKPNDEDVCQNCLLYENCSEELFDNLPGCFGILYSSEDCQDCILKYYCDVHLMLNTGVDSQYEIYLLNGKPMLTNLLTALSRFRAIYQAWPVSMLISKSNRYFDVRKRGIKQRIDNQIKNDMLAFSTDIREKEIVTKRTPIVLLGERKAVNV